MLSIKDQVAALNLPPEYGRDLMAGLLLALDPEGAPFSIRISGDQSTRDALCEMLSSHRFADDVIVERGQSFDIFERRCKDGYGPPACQINLDSLTAAPQLPDLSPREILDAWFNQYQFESDAARTETVVNLALFLNGGQAVRMIVYDNGDGAGHRFASDVETITGVNATPPVWAFPKFKTFEFYFQFFSLSSSRQSREPLASIPATMFLTDPDHARSVMRAMSEQALRDAEALGEAMRARPIKIKVARRTDQPSENVAPSYDDIRGAIAMGFLSEVMQ